MGVCGSKPQHQETGEQVIGGDPEPAFPVGKAPVEAPNDESKPKGRFSVPMTSEAPKEDSKPAPAGNTAAPAMPTSLPFQSREIVKRQSVKEIKMILRNCGVDISACVEKKDLVDTLCNHFKIPDAAPIAEDGIRVRKEAPAKEPEPTLEFPPELTAAVAPKAEAEDPFAEPAEEKKTVEAISVEADKIKVEAELAAGKSATSDRQSWTGTPADTSGEFSSPLANRIAWTGTAKDTNDTWAHAQMAVPTAQVSVEVEKTDEENPTEGAPASVEISEVAIESGIDLDDTSAVAKKEAEEVEDIQRLAKTELQELPMEARVERLHLLFSEAFLRDCFVHLDVDGSNSISLIEFLKLPVVGKNNAIFYELDSDHSGDLDVDEFVTGLQKLERDAALVEQLELWRAKIEGTKETEEVKAAEEDAAETAVDTTECEKAAEEVGPVDIAEVAVETAEEKKAVEEIQTEAAPVSVEPASVEPAEVATDTSAEVPIEDNSAAVDQQVADVGEAQPEDASAVEEVPAESVPVVDVAEAAVDQQAADVEEAKPEDATAAEEVPVENTPAPEVAVEVAPAEASSDQTSDESPSESTTGLTKTQKKRAQKKRAKERRASQLAEEAKAKAEGE